MTRQSHLLAAACFLVLTASGACAQTVAAGDPAHIADLLLDRLAETSGVPGLAASYAHDGEVVWTGVAGLRDVERGLPVEPDTAFRFASVSKLITVTAAARLVQAGRLDPDAPVQAALPYLDNGWPDITARQLAAHTSGIPHYQSIDAGRGSVRYARVEDAVGVFTGRALLAPPGVAYEYSSYGYTLLSAAVEAAAGEPFLNFVARDVTADLDIRPDTDPAGAHDTLAYEFEDGRIRRAPSHNYSYSYGGAGFRGSAPGLAMFGQRVLADDFLSPATRHFMWTLATTSDGASVIHEDEPVAFGWRVSVDAGGARIVNHTGVAIGARSALVLYPDTGDSVSLLSNVTWTSAIRDTAIMLAAPFRVRADDAALACPTHITRFEGRYHGNQIAGHARFALVGGVCQGAISAANEAGAWFNSFMQSDAAELSIIALTADGRLGRAAIVTPAGIYDVRCTIELACRASFGGQRVLEIGFS